MIIWRWSGDQYIYLLDSWFVFPPHHCQYSTWLFQTLMPRCLTRSASFHSCWWSWCTLASGLVMVQLSSCCKVNSGFWLVDTVLCYSLIGHSRRTSSKWLEKSWLWDLGSHWQHFSVHRRQNCSDSHLQSWYWRSLHGVFHLLLHQHRHLLLCHARFISFHFS